MALVKFNAGKVQYDESTHKCTPLPHKGVVTIRPNSDEDGFYDFTWTPKSSNMETDELLLIPGDVTFRRVALCTTGRVVALVFLSSGAKNMYWFQDVGDDDELDKLTAKDLEVIRKVNELISELEEDDGEGTPQPREPLEDILKPDHVASLVSKMLADELRDLFGAHLPEGTEPTRENIMEVVRSSFFRQSMERLCSQLNQQDGSGMLYAQAFGLKYRGEGLAWWLRALREKRNEEKGEKEK